MYNVDGSIKRNKARLMAKGYVQTHGVDYENTFVPVAKMATMRTVIALAMVKGWHLYQMDGKNVFLQDKLQEVYMVQPSDFKLSIHPKAICRLKKPLRTACLPVEDNTISSLNQFSNVKF